MVFIKNLKFSMFLFWQNRPGNVFDDIQERKNKLVQTIKKRSLKRQKIGIFPKGLVQGFSQKI